jgi:hypothetical protein
MHAALFACKCCIDAGDGNRPGRLADPPFSRFHLPLALDAEGGHRAGLEAGKADFFPAVLTDTEGALPNASQGLVDLSNQFAFPVPDSEQEASLTFEGGEIDIAIDIG